ncbi:hypothetical protein [Pediococcus argentinicus]|uniref:OB-fold nucleic acid binding domain-containing protein n=1 Tax=Pediococcus argentinicus TaxID=480391 RepID=A0A0R2NLD7_9LACO|nr:hypothetical protein [Pediococcus argentinicus]KRO25666.1 hypothetical protein IV88_GL001624 [Pediococcus argentinicus]NKZ21997.1 hypothetical protein [Pediococcus argentinicus]GEP19166.1 hypothetical protein LSA03_05500 [Pediococcus argentinicus]
MEKISGFITSKIKIVKYSPFLLRFEVTDKDDHKTNVIIHKNGLTFFEQANQGSAVELHGIYNERKQFVIKEFKVFNSAVMI